MSSTSSAGPSPIYDRLIDEQGDVLAETRKVAEQALREASEALDWSELYSLHRIPRQPAPVA